MYSGSSVEISVDQVILFNLQYPINQYNKTITFQENSDTGVSYTATLTEGSYTGSEIATEIASQLTANTGNAITYTGSYDNNTGKLTISASALNFKLTSINEIFGYEVMTSFASSKVGDYPVNLSGPDYVDLLCPSLVNDNMISRSLTTTGIMKRIPLTVGFGGLVNYQSSQPDDSIIVDRSYLETIRMKLQNPDGSSYLLPSNSHVSITLRCRVLI